MQGVGVWGAEEVDLVDPHIHAAVTLQQFRFQCQLDLIQASRCKHPGRAGPLSQEGNSGEGAVTACSLDLRLTWVSRRDRHWQFSQNAVEANPSLLDLCCC